MSLNGGRVDPLGDMQLKLTAGDGPVHINSDYIDRAYMPVLGPSTVALVRYLHWLFANDHTDGITIEFLAAGVGVGVNLVHRGLERANTTKLLNHHDGVVVLFENLPPVPKRWHDKLPAINLAVVVAQDALEAAQELTAPIAEDDTNEAPQTAGEGLPIETDEDVFASPFDEPTSPETDAAEHPFEDPSPAETSADTDPPAEVDPEETIDPSEYTDMAGTALANGTHP